VPGFCGCDVCRDDVLVYALNRLHPKYVSHRRGEILTTVELGANQGLAEVAVVLMDGLRRVTASPDPDGRHSKA
jgi:hypothetical protein